MFGLHIIAKCFNLISAVIAVFLLAFLLVGCYSTELAYSLVYLLEMLFGNETEFLVASQNQTLTLLTLKSGYLAMCVSSDTSTVCAAAHNLSSLYESSKVELAEGSLSLADIATSLANVCNPHLLVCCIILSLVLTLLILWTAIPRIPGKIFIRRAAFGVGAISVLLWGLGAMLQHQTVLTAVLLVKVSSMDIVSVSRGQRAEAMTWTALLFLIVATIGIGIGCWRDIQEMTKKKDVEKVPY